MRRVIFDTEHDAFRDSVRAFLDRHARPQLASFVERREISRRFWREAGRIGLLGLEVPEEFGGSAAGDYRFNMILVEELAKVSAGLASCVGLHYDMAAPYLVDLGTDEQRRRWLPGVCSGDILLAIAMTEPGGGSDLAAITTKAVPDGTGWIIDGAKTFITNGASADLVLTAARTSARTSSAGGSRGITLFAVEKTDPGFTHGRKLDKVGQPESDTTELFFDHVRVGGDRVVGTVDQGFVHMMQRLPQERLNAACANLSHARQILDETLEYARQRRAFGRPIGEFQHNKFMLAEMVTEAEVTQAYLDACVLQSLDGRIDPVDAAKAKWWTATVQNRILDRCVQLHGGYGYMNEYRVARAWRDARVTSIWAGSNEIMKEIIGRDLGL